MKTPKRSMAETMRLSEKQTWSDSHKRAAIHAAGGTVSDSVLTCPGCGAPLDVSKADLRQPQFCTCGTNIGSTADDDDDALSSVPSDSEAIDKLSGVPCASCGTDLAGSTPLADRPYTRVCASCGTANELDEDEVAALGDFEMTGTVKVGTGARSADGTPARVSMSLSDMRRLTALADRIRRRGGYTVL